MTDPDVTVIIPTHDHAAMLGYAIDSVLTQSLGDLRLVVIGDGVGDDTRDVMADACTRDARVSFWDRPKSVRHAEEVRHEVIGESRSRVIAYHGDDDLLLPWHLAQMLEELEGRDFVHPLPVVVEPDGTLTHLPTDLSRPECRDWHRSSEVPRNAVSLTGVVHTRSSYLRLPHGWRPAPQGHWTDLYMWKQYFALAGLRAATAPRATTIKLPASTREDTAAVDPAAEVRRWWQRTRGVGFRDQWDADVAAAVRRSAVALELAVADGHDRMRRATTDWQAERAALTEQLEASRLLVGALAEERDEARRTLAVVTGSRSWRLAAPLRRLAAAARRDP